jgi:hypothetical protein
VVGFGVWLTTEDRRPTTVFKVFNSSRASVRGGNGNPEGLFQFPVPISGFETRNMKLETDVQPDADQMRRLIG